MDIDGIEFSGLVPVAIIELKHPNIQEINLNDIGMKRLIHLSDMLHLPFLIVVYYFFHNKKILDAKDTDPITHVQYHVIPGNMLAQEIIKEPTDMTEKQYVRLLHEIRDIQMPNLDLYHTWQRTGPQPPVIG